MAGKGLEGKLYISDVLDKARKAKSDTIEQAFKSYEKHGGEKAMDAFQVATVVPAMQEFYNTFRDNMKPFQKGHIPSSKKKEVKAAAVKALEAFFKRADPKKLKLVEGIKDPEERYKILCKEYNEATTQGGDSPFGGGIDKFIDSYIGKKSKNLDKMLIELYHNQSKYAQGMVHAVTSKAFHYNVGRHEGLDVAAHMKKLAKTKGYELPQEHEPNFMMLQKEAFEGLYKGLMHGKWGDKTHESYHLMKPTKDAGH
ncbi:hypothetical protein ACFLZX_03380 [Nanoarchaeota archaeon]